MEQKTLQTSFFTPLNATDCTYKSPNLIMSSYDLSLTEHRIITLGCKKIKPIYVEKRMSPKDLDNALQAIKFKDIEISVSEYKEAFNIKGNNIYDTLEKHCNMLYERSINYFDEANVLSKKRWISGCHFDRPNGLIKLTFNVEMIPDLLVLRRFVPLSNTLLEDKVDRLINIHSKKGFGVVSACRRDKTNEENLKRTEQLKKDLSELGWSYTIGYGGGFQENGNEEGFDVSKPKFNEISVIVYNHNRKNEKAALLKDLIALGKKYNQDDIYYQEPNGKAYWYDKNGEIDATFSGIAKNDPTQQYFTGFNKSRLSKFDKKNITKKGKIGSSKAMEHRFSGIIEGVNPPPATLIEEIKRKNMGEIFISSFNVLTQNEVYNLLNSESCFKY